MINFDIVYSVVSTDFLTKICLISVESFFFLNLIFLVTVSNSLNFMYDFMHSPIHRVLSFVTVVSLLFFGFFFIYFSFILIQFTDSHKHSSMLFALFRHYTSVQILNLVFLMCRFDFRIYELYTNIFIPLFYTF